MNILFPNFLLLGEHHDPVQEQLLPDSSLPACPRQKIDENIVWLIEIWSLQFTRSVVRFEVIKCILIACNPKLIGEKQAGNQRLSPC